MCVSLLTGCFTSLSCSVLQKINSSIANVTRLYYGSMLMRSTVVSTLMLSDWVSHEMKDVVGTFVGHDHVNDYFGDLHGIRLCYGRASGYNTYGRDRFLRGARVIRLREGERQFQTWLRLSDGSLVSEQPEHRPLERQLTTNADPAN